MTTSTDFKFDPFAPGGRNNLFEAYEVLRNEAPVYQVQPATGRSPGTTTSERCC